MKKYRDHYFNRAKQESYPARSVYKLQEIDKRFGLFKKEAKVLDLGAAPGSWTMYAAKAVGPGGRVLGVDLQATDVALPDHARILQGDMLEPSPEVRQAMAELAPVDAVISDMAPKTTGIVFRDQVLSAELCMAALQVAREMLAPGGALVVKIFEGPETNDVAAAIKAAFATVKRFKPKSSRAESKEIFLVAQGFAPADQDK